MPPLRRLLPLLPPLLLVALWLLSLFYSCPPIGRRMLPNPDRLAVTVGVTLPLLLIALALLRAGLPRRLGLMALALLLVTEGWLRAFPPADDGLVRLQPGEFTYTDKLLRPDPYQFYAPRPDIHTAEGLIHNRLGLRDHRPLGLTEAHRVVFLGGSTVYGALVLDNRDTFTFQLERRIAERLGEGAVEVVNAGVVAHSSAESLGRLLFTVAELEPDLVVIQHGLTDVWPRVAADRVAADFSHWRKPWGHPGPCRDGGIAAEAFARFLVYHTALADYLFADHIRGDDLLAMVNRVNGGELEYLQGNPPTHFERNTRAMIHIIRAMGARPALVGETLPPPPRRRGGIGEVYQRGIPEHNRLLARIAAEEGIPYFDLAAALPFAEGERDHGKFLNPAGQRRKAALLDGFLQRAGLLPLAEGGRP